MDPHAIGFLFLLINQITIQLWIPAYVLNLVSFAMLLPNPKSQTAFLVLNFGRDRTVPSLDGPYVVLSCTIIRFHPSRRPARTVLELLKRMRIEGPRSFKNHPTAKGFQWISGRKTNIAYLIICQRSSKETRQQTSDRLWFGKNLRKKRIKNNQNTKNDLNVTLACWNDRNDSHDTNLPQQSSRSASFTTVLQAAAGHRHHSPRQWAPNQGLPSSDSSTEATLVTCILPDFCVQQTLSSFIFVLKSFQGHKNNGRMHFCLHWSITCIIKALVPTRAAALNFKANFIAFIIPSVTANLLIQCMVGGELWD